MCGLSSTPYNLRWQLWYCAAKTVAEETALEYAEKNGLNVITACPCIVFGPQLQPIVNTSSELLIYVLKGLLISSFSFLASSCLFIGLSLNLLTIFSMLLRGKIY